MNRIPDLTGERFGMLTVVKRVDNIGKYAAWLCECDCGNEVIVKGSDLRTYKTHCGCQDKRGHGENSLREQAKKNGISSSTVHSRIYKLGWSREEALDRKPYTKGIILELNGEKHTIKEWASIVGISRDVISARIHNGWSSERALTEKVHRRRGDD